jgi:two-component system, OmpR family, alkaline phosphatase synthesis response regulator PhoP
MDDVAISTAGVHRLHAERLLVADADEESLACLSRSLGHIGYAPDTAHSGRQVLALLQSKSYDVLLLDMHLPDVDSIELLGRIRQLAPEIVIIAMTHAASLDTAIAAIKFRASDYLLKTDHEDQLCSSISTALQQHAKQIKERVLLRALGEMMERLPPVEDPRMPNEAMEPSEVIHIPPIQLNLRERTAVVYEDSNLVCRLTNNEVELLARLMRQADEVVSIKELAESTLGRDVADTTAYSSVSHHVHRLRKKIEVLPGKPRILRTVRGRGYMFVSSVGAKE